MPILLAKTSSACVVICQNIFLLVIGDYAIFDIVIISNRRLALPTKVATWNRSDLYLEKTGFMLIVKGEL
jgi:hypothetical protein